MPAFADDFVWGVASASYQIEGAHREDGRGLSVWDTASHRPGFIFGNQTGDVACDSYHRYEEDSELLRQMGASAYRISVSWPRVLPDGVGQPNEKGLDYYDRLVDSLLIRGIDPWVTIFHWDYPQALFERGGWFNPDSPKWFADYTRLVVERLSDRVKHWFTQNEPQCFIGVGHLLGQHAPGFKFGRREVLLAHYHSLLSHGLSVQAIRAHTRQPAVVGAAPTGFVYFPQDPDRADDIEAARKLTFGVRGGDEWVWSISWFADPLIFGRFPQEGLDELGDDMPPVSDEDLKTIAQPLDFFGFNHYLGAAVTTDEAGEPKVLDYPPGYPQTMVGWFVAPQAIRWTVGALAERYKLPVYITENGLASMDWVHADGKVHDPGRIDYLTRYLAALRDAINIDGVDVRGYFHWSNMDNFEWAHGCSKRFGLIYVDYATLERIPKDSFYWYKKLIETRGDALPKDIAPVR